VVGEVYERITSVSKEGQDLHDAHSKHVETSHQTMVQRIEAIEAQIKKDSAAVAALESKHTEYASIKGLTETIQQMGVKLEERGTITESIQRFAIRLDENHKGQAALTKEMASL